MSPIWFVAIALAAHRSSPKYATLTEPQFSHHSSRDRISKCLSEEFLNYMNHL